jgi:hypothetical protein
MAMATVLAGEGAVIRASQTVVSVPKRINTAKLSTSVVVQGLLTGQWPVILDGSCNPAVCRLLPYDRKWYT